MKVSILYSTFLTFTILVLLSGSGVSQSSQTISIEHIAQKGSLSSLKTSINDKLSQRFIEKGYKTVTNPKWKVLVNARVFDSINSDKVIFTYTLSQSLPKSIVDFGAKNEVFYLTFQKNSMSGEKNKKVREFATSEFLSQYALIMDNKIFVFEKANLEQKLDEIVEEIDSQINFYSQNN